MPKKLAVKFPLPLNIQLFAEGEGGTDGNVGEVKTEPVAKTYSEDEYNKLKSAFDKASSELAGLKKSQKEKMSEEEKKVQAQKERDEEFARVQKELEQMKMSKTLIGGGYDEKQIDKIVEAIQNGDTTILCQTLSDIRKSLVEEITKSVKDEFMKSSKKPDGSSETKDDDENIGSILAKSVKSSNPAREYYDRKRN